MLSRKFPIPSSHTAPLLKTNVIETNNQLHLISLNINGLNSPIQRHKLRDWKHKQIQHFAAYKKHTSTTKKNRNYLRVKGWKKGFQANGPKKKAGVVILISNKIDFQPKVIKQHEKVHYILIKRKIQQNMSQFWTSMHQKQGYAHS
jgi:exonuclease III